MKCSTFLFFCWSGVERGPSRCSSLSWPFQSLSSPENCQTEVESSENIQISKIALLQLFQFLVIKQSFCSYLCIAKARSNIPTESDSWVALLAPFHSNRSSSQKQPCPCSQLLPYIFDMLSLTRKEQQKLQFPSTAGGTPPQRNLRRPHFIIIGSGGHSPKHVVKPNCCMQIANSCACCSLDFLKQCIIQPFPPTNNISVFL
jgi:hypothetical protein